jgi:drug/metabolite transporter (DMT)-like permease
MKILETKLGQYGLMIILAFIWGTSFILMKKGLLSFTHDQVAAFRIFISFIFLLPFIIQHLKKINKKNIKSFLIAGFIGTAIPAFLFTKAQTQIDSALAGILNSTTPLFALIIGMTIYRTTPKWYNIIGVLIGFVGAAGLMFKGETGIFDSINWFALFIIAATTCYGINVNEVKTFLSNYGGITITSLGFLVIGPWAGIYLLFQDYSFTFTTEGYGMNFLYIVILALFSSVIALIGFNTLIKYTTALFASSVTYIIPIFAIFWGLIDGETISIIQFAWMGLILAGVYLVNRK